MVSLVGAQACPQTPKAVAWTCSVKKVFLQISENSQEKTCARVSFLIKLEAPEILLKKEALAQVFSCEFYEISHLVVAPETRPLRTEWYKILKIIHCGISPTG